MPHPAQRSFKADTSFQPIYKLHGSSNWTRADGQPLLIMGGAKVREIGQTPILNWYARVFEESVSIAHQTRALRLTESLGPPARKGLGGFIAGPSL